MPTAEDLFRPTAVPDPPDDEAEGPGPSVAAVEQPAGVPLPEPEPDPAPGPPGARGASGRVRHDQKMTVYVTEDELLDLEHARLQLRRRHGVAVDRGRLVREAVALVLADLETDGGESPLVRRLAGE
jgi:hypothetical protein